ncbi:hypothetical protein NGM37_18980, partial [Streptomyces sp. TRM76130]|nr:hypothetical protein [Streptomyces sp. TRM76130]
AERQGGSAVAGEAPGGGAEFTVVLPEALADSGPPGADTGPGSTRATAGPDSTGTSTGFGPTATTAIPGHTRTTPGPDPTGASTGLPFGPDVTVPPFRPAAGAGGEEESR